ncbi:hypothetical protein ACIBTZ_12495 [Micromonospora sp. NPDC049460]|uniref:hypothetical protein n=1 Tax=Micromonospora sp. NPDC049460 TaxID=3364272 RepID=UPI00379E6C3C
MSMDDPDPLMIALRMVIVVLSSASVVLGLRVAMSRRFPAAWIRLAHLTPSQQAQPVRLGSAQAMLGAGLLIQQAPFVISMPFPVGVALFAVSLALLLTAVGLSALLRH